MVVSFASGKGGTGKTFVSTNLASSTFSCQFLDCDVEEPNAHIFLKPFIQSVRQVSVMCPEVLEAKCNGCGRCAEFCQYNAIVMVKGKPLVFPELCHYCGGCVLVCPEEAIADGLRIVGQVELGTARGTIEFVHGILNVGENRAEPVIAALKNISDLGRGGICIVDCPPGTACPMVKAVEGSDFCVLVTEPTPFGLSDLKQAVAVLRALQIPHCVVVNRDGIGDGGVDEYCRDEGIDVLARIPYDRLVAQAYSRGELMVDVDDEWREFFKSLLNDVLERAQR